MADFIDIALIFSNGTSSRMLREVIRAIGGRVAYESSAEAFAPNDLATSGVTTVVVDLTPEAEIDAIFDLLDDERYRVIVNDAEVTSGLSGWEHARWARHLAAKILDVPAVVDPPRPEETPVLAAVKATSARPLAQAGRQFLSPAASGAELGIDDWLSDVLHVKDPEGRFADAPLPVDEAHFADAAPIQESATTAQRAQSRRKFDQPETSEVPSSAAPEAEVSEPDQRKTNALDADKPAAEERFDWNIEEVIRDIDDWLPLADPALSMIEPARAARLWSMPEREAGTEPMPVTAESAEAETQRESQSGSAAATGTTFDARWAPPLDERRILPAQTLPLTLPSSIPGIAAMSGTGAGRLAHSLDLSEQEEAALSPLFEDQARQAEVSGLVIDVVPDAATVSRVIVLCASVGGPEAIRVLLGAIPASHPALFLVVQQVGEEFLDLLSQQLRRSTALRVRSADVGDQLRDGEVIPVSPRQRLVIDRSGRVMMNQRTDAQGSAPMNQVLRDVSDHFGADCTAVVLSGIASDAADGCRYVAERGGHVCAQASASCVSSGMVEQVQQTGVVGFTGTPNELAAHLLLDRS